MSYKKQPVHIQADADYFAHELLNSEIYVIDVEKRIDQIDNLEFAKLVINSLVDKND